MSERYLRWPDQGEEADSAATEAVSAATERGVFDMLTLHAGTFNATLHLALVASVNSVCYI